MMVVACLNEVSQTVSERFSERINNRSRTVLERLLIRHENGSETVPDTKAESLSRIRRGVQ